MTFADWRKALLAYGWTAPTTYGKQLQSPKNVNGDYLVLKLACARDDDDSDNCVLRLRGNGMADNRLLPTPKTLQAMLQLLYGLEILGAWADAPAVVQEWQWLLLGPFAVRAWDTSNKLLVVSPQAGEAPVLYDMRDGTARAWPINKLDQREVRAVVDCRAPDCCTESA